MKNDPTITNFTGTGAELYPHLKITNETYPRVLATRKIENDGAQYFGAFLTKTATRILIDFVNRIFRLRSCDIPIDGKFPVPCTQHYHRRCVAPCVESLCGKKSYLKMVDLVRLFLANRRSDLIETLNTKIESASDDLDFEAAAYWRDILEAVHDYWSKARWHVWLDGEAVDTFAIENHEKGLAVFLVTQRGRYVLGRKVFGFSRETTVDEAMERILDGFYQFYAPREIRVSEDFADRKKLSKRLSEKFGRVVPINVVTKSTVRTSTLRAVRLMRDESEVDAARPRASNEEISSRLQEIFELTNPPARVEAFDVAHISGKSFVSANSSWTLNGFQPKNYMIRFGKQRDQSELTALARGVVGRLAYPWLEVPGLIILDGGKAQLNAVVRHWHETDHIKAPFIAAVKPWGKHSSISYFLTENGKKIPFDPSDPAHNLLQLLRDEAHDLANRAHRDLRDMAHNYELATILPSINEADRRAVFKAVGSIKKLLELSEEQISDFADARTAKKVVEDLANFRAGKSEEVYPLIVPIRFDDENGGADDLRPIVTR